MGRFPHFCSDFALGTAAASILRLAANVIVDLYDLSHVYF
jgi:hypothetical protein